MHLVSAQGGSRMKKIHISGGELSAVILPDFGGMVSELNLVGGISLLRMRYNQLGACNVLTGGIPVLFPFVSKCWDDEAVFKGSVHTYPIHGFAKDLSFAVEKVGDSLCVLSLESSAATKRIYPFDFRLVLSYEIRENRLTTAIQVDNLDDAPMPFAAGFHPYFYAPDKERITFHMNLKEFWDHDQFDEEGNPFHGNLDGELDLTRSRRYNTIFWSGDPNCEIINQAQGYQVKLLCGETFKYITVFTGQPDVLIVEPWQARPDAPRRPDECQILAPHTSGRYEYSILAEKLKKGQG